MALIRRSAASLAALADTGSVAELMFEQTLYGYGPRPSPGEARSWSRSIPVLAHDLVQAGLGDVEVLLGDGTVTPINLATGTTGIPISAGSAPLGIAVTPDGKTAYVVDGTSDTVTPINLATGTTGTPITVGKYPVSIVITR